MNFIRTTSLKPKHHHSFFYTGLLYSTATSSSVSASTTTPLDRKTDKTERPPSSCKAGTVMKGLNIYAGKADPVALPDEEYPDWLWDCLEPAKKEFTPEEMLSQAYLRHLSKQKIKENAMSKKF